MSEFEIWNELGEIYYNIGAYDQAVLIYQKLITLNPFYSKSYCSLASIFVRQGRFTEAIPMFQKGIEFADEAFDKAYLWNLLGDTYRKLEDCVNAACSYRKAIELSPQDSAPQRSLAEIESAFQAVALESGIRNAEETFVPAPVLEEDILIPEPVLMDSGSMQAKESNSEILPTHPETMESSNLGNACWVYKESQLKIPDEQNPVSAPEMAPMMLGSRILSNSSIEEDISKNLPSGEDGNVHEPATSKVVNESYSSALEKPETFRSDDVSSPPNLPAAGRSSMPTPQALLRLGILHWRKGEYERAIQFLNMAIDSSDKSQNHFMKALCYNTIALVDTDLGKIDEAIHAFQSSANLAEENIFPWNNLGYLYCMLARYDEARAAFQEAIEHRPKDSASWNGLGDVYHRLGRNEDAIAAYQLGNVFDSQGSETDALAEFEKSLLADQRNPEVWNEAGNIYFANGMYNEAIDSYRTAVELDPSNAALLANLAKAEKILGLECSESKQPAFQTCAGNDPNVFQPQESSIVPEASSGKPEDLVDLNPEPSYWVFDKVSSPGKFHPQTTQQVPLGANSFPPTIKPKLDFTLQTHNSQTFSSDQVPPDTRQNPINVLIQLSPRPLKPPTGETVFPTSAGYNLERTSAKLIPESNQISSTESEIRTSNASHGAAPGNQTTLQSCADLQTLEKDIAAYRRVTELNPRNDRAWDALGSMFDSVGLHEEAIAAFEQAIALCPHKEVYYYHLGMAHAYQLHFDKAIQALQTVVEINPDYVLAHCALAGYYRKLGKETEAQEHIKKARPSMVNESEYNQACFESISGNTDRALSLLEVALEKEQFQPAMVRNDPDLDFIRADPRFEMLIQKNRIINL